MYAVGRLSSYISQGVYTVSAPFHPFGGAVDIIVVEQPDGSFKSSPWYVKFGKFQGVLKTKEKIVSLSVNGIDADFHMYLDHKGEAYFLREVDGEEIDESILSPPSSGDDETEEKSSRNGRMEGLENCAYNGSQLKLDAQIELDSGKILVRTNSRRARIFGMMFGRKSIKEKKKLEAEGDVAMERTTSLERAEIAADLLEVKWSTNLPTDRLRRDNLSRMSASVLVQNSSDLSVVQDAMGPCNGQVSSRSEEHIKDLSTRGTVGSEEKSKNSRVGEHEVGSDLPYNVESVSDERMYLQSVGVPYEESENLFLHHETSESGVAVNSSEQGLETLKFSEGECEESRVYAGTQSETAKLASEENTQPEYAALMSKHKPTTEELRSDDEFQITNAILQCGEISASSDTKDGVIESHSSLGKHSVASQYGDAGILELAHQETITERPSEGRCLQTGPVETVAERSQANGFSKPCVSRSTEVSLGEPSTLSGSSDLILGANNVAHFDEEAESQGVCVSSCGSNSVSLVKEEVHLGEEDEVSSLYNTLDFVGDPQGSNTEYIRATHSSNLLLEGLEEAQFIFSDIDNHETSGIQCKDSVFPDSEEIDENPLMRNDVEDWNDKTNREHWSQLSSIKVIEECSPDDIEPLLEDLMKKSSPMKIPRSRKCAEEEVEWMIESLPNFRSHIDNLEMSDVIHPLSQSLDLHSESLRQEFLRKDVSGSSLSNLDTERKLAGEHRRAEDTRIWEEIKNMSNSSLVEISLCKHLLYEGMGADAASQVFDAGKVDLENFTSLDPQLMKNDDIIVRIGGRYFPWDAAASIISKMLSLGHNQSIVPEGMVDVDQIEKTVEGQLTRTNVPSGGSWSLWPFNFRRSRSVSPILPPPDGTTNSDCMNASVRTSDATGNKSVQIVKVAKKKVKSLVPTSEQLATLNLKEGRNVITFTFSTAMLGKQQVDARIYLWKWDTRIVVSDVDGTITRSDVLGQFMPLVGKDWSQTGVAHLFSAIKENGYQLLFLSARAISQAYLTRQFLFNLKQDGKALPDGPVVISPDGLFPSLFREVIRRAPHEFKIACLQDIRALFPPDCNPFYAGFGNRVTDEISYLKLGIPKGKIFTINAKGEVAVNRRFDRKSYTTLHALVDGMFPSTSLAEQEDFNSWNYWKMPLPDINS